MLNSSVKTIPAVVACPWDQEDKLYLIPDGAGLYGYSGDFHGDAIEVVKKVYNLKSTNQALLKLEENGCVDSVSDIPDEVLTRYELTSATHRAVTTFMNVRREATKSLDLNLELLTRMNLMPDDVLAWSKGVGRHIVFSEKKKLEALLHTKVGIRNTNLMLLPYYDVPNRVSRLQCVYASKDSYASVTRDVGTSGGLFMADTIEPGAPLAIAMSDPFTAINLQREHANISNKPLPLVVYNQDTEYWHVWANRIIFWGMDYSVEMFKQAKKLDNASISVTEGTLTMDGMLKIGTTGWMSSVAQYAKPWVVALKEYVISLDAEKAEAVIRAVGLTSEQQGHLLYECATDEREFIKGLIDSGYTAKEAYIEDKKFVERNDAWHVLSTKGRLSKITNVTFSIETILDCGDGGMYYQGLLCHEQQEYRFMAPVDEFSAHPTKWLQRFMLKKGIGKLYVQKAWQGKLLDLEHMFSSNKVAHKMMSTHVGWSPDFTQFSFPKLAVEDGYAIQDAKELPGENLPCANVTGAPPKKSQIRALLEDSQVNRYFWATFASIIDGLTAKYLGKHHKTTVFTGNSYFFEIFYDMMGLCTVQLPSANPAYIKDKLRALHNHDIPELVMADAAGAAYYNWAITGVPTTAIPFVDSFTAELLSSEGVQYMTTKAFEPKLAHLMNVHNLFALYVKELQRNKAYFIDNFDTSLAASSNLLAEWIEERLEGADTTVIREAPLLIRTTSPSGLQLKNKLYYSLFAGVKVGKIGMNKVGYRGGKKAGIHIGKEYVQVKPEALAAFPTGCNKEQLISNADGVAEQHMTEVLLERAVWDSEFEKWTKAQIA